MTFCELVDQYLEQDVVRPEIDDQVVINARDVLVSVTELVATAAAALLADLAQDTPSAGFEVDVASDYDAGAQTLSIEASVTVVGDPAYSTMTILLQQGFDFLVDTGTFTLSFDISLASLGGAP